MSSCVASQLECRAPYAPTRSRAPKGFGAECLYKILQGAGRDGLRRYKNVVNRSRSAHGRRIHVTFDEGCATTRTQSASLMRSDMFYSAGPRRLRFTWHVLLAHGPLRTLMARAQPQPTKVHGYRP